MKVHILLSSNRGTGDNGVDEYSELYSDSLSSFSSLRGWWRRRAAVSFYELRALEKNKFQSSIQIANEKHTREVGRSWRSIGGWGGGFVHDGYGTEMSASLRPRPAMTSNASGLNGSRKHVPPSAFFKKTV